MRLKERGRDRDRRKEEEEEIPGRLVCWCFCPRYLRPLSSPPAPLFSLPLRRVASAVGSGCLSAVCLSVCLSAVISPAVDLSICVCLPTCLSVCQSFVRLRIGLSVGSVCSASACLRLCACVCVPWPPSRGRHSPFPITWRPPRCHAAQGHLLLLLLPERQECNY